MPAAAWEVGLLASVRRYGNFNNLTELFELNWLNHKGADMTSPSHLMTSNEIEQQAVHIICEFLKQAAPINCPHVEWTFIKEPDYISLRHGANNNQSITVVERDGTLHLSICSEDFLGIPVEALQGWLELEIVHALVEADTDSYRFNFQNQILPLMPLSGGSLYFIRELVEQLSRALKRREATKIITKMHRSLPLVYYYFYTFNPTAQDRELYKKLIPHNWTRASHLCGKLGEYMALSYLADQDIGFSHSLFSDWQKQYEYTEKDQDFLKNLVFIVDHYQDKEFSFRLVKMFKLLKETLLTVRSDDTVANNQGLSV